MSLSSAQPAAAPAVRFRFSPGAIAFVLATIVIAALPFGTALTRLFDVWNMQPEYSHGVLIPLIAAFLIWQQRGVLATLPFQGAWSGLGVVAFGLAMWLIGEMSTIYVIVQYSFVFVLYGLVISLVGWPVFRRLAMPFGMLLFMIPLPAFFFNALSLQLQLISSALGVAIVRLFGISVFLEGNVIDLGVYKLQVAEACNGLRYLFPLMTLAFIMAYFFRAPMWKRILLFAASVPVAILMNSIRIGVIGVTVEYWGVRMAEGVLHDFEGWLVFMMSTLVLFGVAVVLTRIGKPRQRLRDALSFDFRGTSVRDGQPTRRALPHSFIGAAVLATTASISAFSLTTRADEATPPHKSLTQFPLRVESWQGHQEALETVYQDALNLDDYVLANYRDAQSLPVNFYVAWYDSQRKGHSVHSPRACIPGGGWVISSFDEHQLTAGTRSFPVNRAVVELGNQKQIVYYWFQQRGRTLTNEYLVKWYIFWDALTRNRTDGALVRFTAPVLPGMDESQADAEIAKFAATVLPTLTDYIPD